MSITNKVIATFILRNDCSQDDDEVERYWRPLFDIYDSLFIDLINEAIMEWLSENTLKPEYAYEVIFAHRRENDGAGAVTAEYFEPIYSEFQEL